MNPASDESGARLIAIFDEAKLHPPGEPREQFLAQACAGEAKLRANVDELLRAHDAAGSFLKPAAAVSMELEAEFARLKPEEAGDRIGPYRLLEQIGEGGFGTVWVAEQARPVRRRVALKIIKLGMDTKEVIARFEQERQAVAMMDHANIAKVFDAGATETGRPYFVMELVHGIKITEYCDQANLSTAQRLELLISVCHAVQHAHQKGIIHRDLKPSNILVTLHDGVPVPKVIDFGVAKATQHQRLTDLTVYTQFQQMIGTPVYMSPEQAEMSGLDIDTRSDIYSLGVLLYELLTGRTPFEAEELMRVGVDEMRRVIREEEPKKPSTALSTMVAARRSTVAQHRDCDAAKLISAVQGDLDWIAMKCLEKDRTRRYETANGLAADLQRHLDNQPVLARPPSRTYQFQKFVRRNKLAVTAISGVAAALVIGLGAATWMFFKERDARERAESAESAQNKLRQQAEGNEKQAEMAATKSREVALLLQQMLAGVGPSVALGRDTRLLREILDKTAARIAVDLKNQPDVEAEIRSTLGATYLQLGDYSEGEAMAREVLRIRRATLPPNDPALIESGLELARLLARRGTAADLKEAKALLAEGLPRQREIYGPEHVETVRWVALTAGVLHRQGELALAEAASREALAIRRKLHPPDHQDIASSLDNLALVLRDLGKLDDAESSAREALEIQRKSPSLALEVGTSLQYLGSILERKKQFPEAETAYREALQVRRALHGGDNRYTELIVSSLANVLTRQGKHVDAAAVYQEEAGIRRKLFGEQSPKLTESLRNMGAALIKSGDGKWRTILEEERKRASGDPAAVAKLLHEFGAGLRETGNAADAELLFREAVEIRKRVLGPEHRDISTSLSNWGLALRDVGKLEEAERAVRESLSMWRSLAGDDAAEIGWCQQYLGGILERMKKLQGAEAAYREGVRIHRQAAKGESAQAVATLNSLISLLRAQGKHVEIAALYRDEKDFRERIHGAGSAKVIESIRNLAAALAAAGDHRGADASFREAVNLSGKLSGQDQLTNQILAQWGRVHLDKGRFAEAEKVFREQVEFGARSNGKVSADFAIGNLVRSISEQGTLVEAEAKLREDLAAARKASGNADAAVTVWLQALAAVIHARGHFAEAEPLLQESAAIRRKALGATHSETIAAMVFLASTWQAMGKSSEAVRLYREAIEKNARRSLSGKDNPDTAMAGLAQVLLGRDMHVAAETLLREAMKVATETLRTQPYVLVEEFTRVLVAAGKDRELEAWLRKEVEIARASEGGDSHTAVVLHHIAEAHRLRKALKAAIALAEEASDLYERNPKWPEGERNHALQVLQRTKADLAQSAAEETQIRERIKEARAKRPEDQAELAESLGELVTHFLELKDFVEAEPIAREHLALREREAPDDWITFEGRSLLGRALARQGKHAEAERLLLSGYEGMKERASHIRDADKNRLQSALHALIDFYETTERTVDLSKWRNEWDQVKASGVRLRAGNF